MFSVERVNVSRRICMLSLCSLDVFVRAPVVKWNNNEYFIDWTDDQLAALEEDVRPRLF